MKNKTEAVDKLERFLIDNKNIDVEMLKEIYPFLKEIKEQLSIHGVVKSFTVKDDRNYKNWLKDECVKTSKGNFIYKLAEYTEEGIWQKWYLNDL